MVDACLELKWHGAGPGEERSGSGTAGAGSTMPGLIGCVGAPLLGASIYGAVRRMGVRGAATGAFSPFFGAIVAIPAVILKSFPNTFAAILADAFGFGGRNSAASPKSSRFAECAAPRTVRLAPRAGHPLPSRLAGTVRFSLLSQGVAQQAVRETQVSHETGPWQRSMINKPAQS